MHTRQVALVTGANQGIGLQIAKELAARELTVLVGSRNLARGTEAAASISGDARAIQLDVTDRVSVAEAARRIRSELGRLDVLVQNAAISNVRKTQLGLTLAESAQYMVASKVSIDEVKQIWETNVFGVLAVYQAMLPLLLEAPVGRIVNVSSGVGSLTRTMDPSFGYRRMFAPGYSASKTAMNAMTVAMAVELEGTRVKINAVSPGFTKTNLNGYEGTETLEEGAAQAVKMALIGADGPHGTFTGATLGTLPW
jgi:NAD(P)-dependent dehydrogenase (short-subunit alcohol dehydrogenase family)